MTPKTIALFGAAGSMGTRASKALKNDPAYRVLHIEHGPASPGSRTAASRRSPRPTPARRRTWCCSPSRTN